MMKIKMFFFVCVVLLSYSKDANKLNIKAEQKNIYYLKYKITSNIKFY